MTELSFDFDALAARFDRFLPQIEPVGLAVIDHVQPAAGATVLDVACGTGEPGLSLARRSPEVNVLGVDQAEAMVGVARGKATHSKLANARFDVMQMNALTLVDASVDAVISRFGLLMFGDVIASARELARVLRRGGSFSVAVWDDPAENTVMGSLVAILRDHLPPGHPSPLDPVAAWAGEQRRTRLLEDLGFSVHTEMFRWDYRFESFDEPWEMVSSMGKLTGQADLSPEVQAQVRESLKTSLAAYRTSEGRYVIPHGCRLFWGTAR